MVLYRIGSLETYKGCRNLLNQVLYRIGSLEKAMFLIVQS